MGVAEGRMYTGIAGGQIGLSGSGYIAGEAPGLVTVAGVPARRRVELRDKTTGRLVGVTLSGSDGTYRFDGLNPARKFVVMAFDHQLVYNAVIRDNITPAVDE